MAHLDREPRPCRRSERALGRTDSSDTSDQEVRLREVELGRQREGHDGRRGVDFGFPGRDDARRVVGVAGDVGEQWRSADERDVVRQVELLGLEPNLALGRELHSCGDQISFSHVSYESWTRLTIDTIMTLGS